MRQVEVVGAVVYSQELGYLCALRGNGMSQAGLWEFPGGKIEAGEDPKQALKREIAEELDCHIEVGEYITSCTYDYPAIRVKLHTYFASLLEGTPKAKEHEELRWAKRKELAQLNWAPADIPTVEKIISTEADY